MHKTMLTVLAASLVFGAMGAQAADAPEATRRSPTASPTPTDNRRHFELGCQFTAAVAVGAAKGKGGIGAGAAIHNCTAVARFRESREDNDGDDLTTMNNNNNRRRNRLLITCDGAILYNGRAQHNELDGFDYISGFGGNPALRVPDINPSGFSYLNVPAWLSVGPLVIPGVCQIQRSFPEATPTPWAE